MSSSSSSASSGWSGRRCDPVDGRLEIPHEPARRHVEDLDRLVNRVDAEHRDAVVVDWIGRRVEHALGRQHLDAQPLDDRREDGRARVQWLRREHGLGVRGQRCRVEQAVRERLERVGCHTYQPPVRAAPRA